MALRYLLDTHTFVWSLARTSELSTKATEALQDPENEILYSPVSAYEITIKHGLGKWPQVAPLATSIDGWASRAGYVELPIATRHMTLAGRLPSTHRDPFDRILAAQALTENLVLVTRDARIGVFGVSILAT